MGAKKLRPDFLPKQDVLTKTQGDFEKMTDRINLETHNEGRIELLQFKKAKDT
jgi:hypothetical protein